MMIRGKRYDTYNTLLCYGFLFPLVFYLFLYGIFAPYFPYFIAGLVGVFAMVIILRSFRSIPTPYNWKP